MRDHFTTVDVVSFQRLAEKHLAGRATEDDIRRLEGNPREWREALTRIVQKCDADLIQAKERMFRHGAGGPSKAEFERSKSELVDLKMKTARVLHEVKGLVAAHNRENAPHTNDLILAELRAIRNLLEERWR